MNIEIGEKLSELRKNNNYTQKRLAELLGVKPATIGHWEQNRNEPSYEMLKKITVFIKFRYLNYLKNQLIQIIMLIPAQKISYYAK